MSHAAFMKKTIFSLKNIAYESYLLTDKFDTIGKIKQLM